MRLLSSLLIALAMFVSPVAMASGSAAAMPHGSVMEAVAAAAHCAETEAPVDRETPEPGMSCIATCAAFPALPSIIHDPFRPAKALHPVTEQQHLATIAIEGETPPPRMTPRI